MLIFAHTARAQNVKSADCLQVQLSLGSDYKTYTWTAETGYACLETEYTERGTFHIQSGHVFTAPLTKDGEIYPTEIKEGELAPQLVPTSFFVDKGDKTKWEPTWLPSGTELGFGYNYTKDYTCDEVTINTNEDFFYHSWYITETSCIRTIFPEPGTITVTGGWVFTAPLELDSVEYVTYFAEGEIAPQLSVYTATVTEKETWEWLATPTSSGAQLGFWYTYVPSEPEPPVCEKLTPSLGSGEYEKKWAYDDPADKCVEVTFSYTGTFKIISGYVFTAPLYLNGEIYETFIKPDELAPQLSSYSADVLPYEKWVFTPTELASGTELLLRYEYVQASPPPEKEYKMFLPVIIRSEPPLEAVYKVETSDEVVSYSHSWPEASPSQETCIILSFANTPNDAKIESGWYFGETLKGYVDGTEIKVPVYRDLEEEADQIDSFELTSPSLLKLCTQSNVSIPEIGVRVLYQA
jgi:hypothetical protein